MNEELKRSADDWRPAAAALRSYPQKPTKRDEFKAAFGIEGGGLKEFKAAFGKARRSPTL